MDLQFHNQNTTFSLPENNIADWVVMLCNEKKLQAGEISIIFCSDEFLLQINQKYLSHDYYTDIITFDYSVENTLSGDLFISIDRVKENAEKYKTPFLKELFRVIIHGILHLSGQKDHSDIQRKQMQEQEEFYLRKYADKFSPHW